MIQNHSGHRTSEVPTNPPGKGPIGSFAVLLFKGSQIPDPI